MTTVNAVLRHKGSEVVTIDRNETVRRAVALLAERQIGAVLVTDRQDAVVGVFSERDLVRSIARQSEDCLTASVGDVMTSEIVSCRPEDSITTVMGLMTDRRIRHLPVMRDGRLIGIISIGDVVKSRISEIESESSALRSYIATG